MRKFSPLLVTLSVLLMATPGVSDTPGEALQRNNLGASLLQQGKLDEAIVELRKAAELDPKYVGAYLNLGYAYDRQGRTDEATAQYQKVVALEPDNLFAHNNLGVLYDKKGLYAEAIKEFERVLQVDPSNATARDNLERAKSSKGIIQEREERFAQARKEVEARPDDPRAAYNLGRLHASFSEKEQALKWLAKALELGFDDVKFLKDDPALVPLKDDPRFTGLLKGR